MKILPNDGMEFIPSKKSLSSLVKKKLLTDAQINLAAELGMVSATHEVRLGAKILAYLYDAEETTSVLPVVMPARFSRGVTQFEFDQLMSLTH